MLKRKRISKSKRAVIISTTAFSAFLLILVGATVAIFASQTHNIQSNIAITYVSQEVDGDMRLRAYYSGTWHNMTGTNQNGFVRLNAGSSTSPTATNLSNIALNSANNYIVFECAFKNTGAHMVKMSFGDAIIGGAPTNMTRAQKISRLELNSSDFSKIASEMTAYNAVAVCGTDDDNYLNDYTYYYVKVNVTDLSSNASYNTTHTWTFTSDVTSTEISLDNRIYNNNSALATVEAGGVTEYINSINVIDGSLLPIIPTSNLPTHSTYTFYTYADSYNGFDEYYDKIYYKKRD